MLAFKLIYLIVLIVSGFFFVLYKDILALILFLVIFCIPIFLFLALVIMRLGVKISTNAENSVISDGSKAKIIVKINNYTFLPITQLQIFAKYKNNFFNDYDKSEFTFGVGPFSKTSFVLEFGSSHTGNVEIELPKAKVLDFFGIFSLPVNLKKHFTVSFLPKLTHLDVALRQNLYTLSESDVYSKHKPGDDPSEVFAIRDYVAGDKLNRIHWKLSSKQEKFMVKDYSLPISENVLLMPELITTILLKKS